MNIKRYISLWLVFARNSLLREMEFKGNFLTDLSVEAIWTLVTLFALEAIFSQTSSMAGWTQMQIILIYGIYRLSSAFSATILHRNLYHLPKLINSGDFDLYLTKPVSILFYSFTRLVSFHRLPQLVIAIAIIIYSMGQMSGDIQFINVVKLILLLPFIFLLRFSIEIMSVTPIFWLQKLENIYELVYTVFTAARFPRQAFPFVMRTFFTLILPVFFLSSIPAEIVLGRPSAHLILGTIVMCGAFAFLAHHFFYFALRYYSSASS